MPHPNQNEVTLTPTAIGLGELGLAINNTTEGLPNHFDELYKRHKHQLTIEAIPSLLKLAGIAAVTNTSVPFKHIWDDFKDTLNISHFRNQDSGCSTLLCVATATLLRPNEFIEFWEWIAPSVSFQDLIHTPTDSALQKGYLFSILQKIIQKDNIDEKLKSAIKSILVKTVSFQDAYNFFQANPKEIKLKKFSETNNSYLHIENIIYTVRNKRTHPLAILGKGGQGTVKAIENESKNIYTVKCQYGNLQALNQDEINLLTEMKQLLGLAERVLPSPKTIGSTTFEHKTYKIQPFVEGNTLHYEMRSRNLSLVQKLIIAIKLCQAVDHLHQHHHAIHGDLKPSNIMVHFPDASRINNIVVKLIDLGGAKKLPEGHLDVKRSDQFGTKGYRAPEISSLRIFSFASDIYALGVIFLRDLSLNIEILKDLTPMRAGSRNYRPLLSDVITTLINALEKQPDLDNDSLQAIDSAKKNGAALLSGELISPQSNHFVLQEKAPLLELIPRSTQSTIFYGDENSTVANSEINWIKIDSSVDFVANKNPYWVSLGSSRSRERLFFNIGSEKMNDLFESFYSSLNATIFSNVETLLKQVANFVYHIQTKPGITNVSGYQDIFLDNLIEKGELVCRHKTLITIKLLTTLISLEHLPMGIVRQYRSDITTERGGAHTVATYRNLGNNDIFIIDGTNNTITQINNFPYKTELLRLFGNIAICDMQKRLGFLDIYQPFLDMLNKQAPENLFPFIESAHYHERRKPGSFPTIQIKCKKNMSNCELYSFINALTSFSLPCTTNKTSDLTFEISFISHELLANCNGSHFYQHYEKSYQLFKQDENLKRVTTRGTLLNRIKRLKTSTRKKLKASVENNNISAIQEIHSYFSAALHPKSQNSNFKFGCSNGLFEIVEYFCDRVAQTHKAKGLITALIKNYSDIYKFLIARINYSVLSFTQKATLLETCIEHNHFEQFKLLLTVVEQSYLIVELCFKKASQFERTEFCEYLLSNHKRLIREFQIKEAYQRALTQSLVMKNFFEQHCSDTIGSTFMHVQNSLPPSSPIGALNQHQEDYCLPLPPPPQTPTNITINQNNIAHYFPSWEQTRDKRSSTFASLRTSETVDPIFLIHHSLLK